MRTGDSEGGVVVEGTRRAPRRAPRRAATTAIVVVMSDFTNESVAAIEHTLNDVDRVLERLRVGNYRTCQVCQSPLDDAQLVTSPLSATCPAHPELA
jgi:RNA polymerase-binding transcription factor DksA